MKKSDLKTGMLVENRGGRRGLVLLGTEKGDIIAAWGNKKGNETWNLLDSFDDDLNLITSFGSDANNVFSIVKVYSQASNMFAADNSVHDRILLFEKHVNKVKLNEDYTAEIDTNKGTVKVGCQTFDIDIIKKLYDVAFSK